MIRNGARISDSLPAYQSGSSVLARSRVRLSSMGSRRPMLRGIQQAASSRGASISTSIGYRQPIARCSSTAASGSSSAGGTNDAVCASTLVILSTRSTRRASLACDQHSRYQRPRRTTTAHGSTSIGHSSSWRRYWIVTRRQSALCDTRAAVISGSGVRAPGSGPRAGTLRIASVDRATASGSTRTIFPSASSTGSAAPRGPSSTAITSPSASVGLNINGGSRKPRPTR